MNAQKGKPCEFVCPLLFTLIMSTVHPLNHQENVYLAATIASSSRFFDNPAALASIHPSLTYIGIVGQMRDVQLLSVPRESWQRIQGEVLGSLNGLDGIRRVDVQDSPRARVKRGDEF
ncbi:hypothetical protein AcV5_005566 [Taiwanofungus camphoratus]|nr:hypothetical protein AcV5_005566 [Antrodia cinnamomea]KAI0948785.1 hypothetical protein AcV7_009439 [Antrodia cinnamomea]